MALRFELQEVTKIGFQSTLIQKDSNIIVHAIKGLIHTLAY